MTKHLFFIAILLSGCLMKMKFPYAQLYQGKGITFFAASEKPTAGFKPFALPSTNEETPQTFWIGQQVLDVPLHDIQKIETYQTAPYLEIRITFQGNTTQLIPIVTEKQIDQHLAIVIDGYFVSAPKVMERIEGNAISISGAEADLAPILQMPTVKRFYHLSSVKPQN